MKNTTVTVIVKHSFVSRLKQIWNAPAAIDLLFERLEELEEELEDATDTIRDMERDIDDLDIPDGEELAGRIEKLEDESSDAERALDDHETRVAELEAEHVDTTWADAVTRRLDQLEGRK